MILVKVYSFDQGEYNVANAKSSLEDKQKEIEKLILQIF